MSSSRRTSGMTDGALSLAPFAVAAAPVVGSWGVAPRSNRAPRPGRAAEDMESTDRDETGRAEASSRRGGRSVEEALKMISTKR